ncbi:MAG: glycosyltransferase family 4 protein [Chloroflexota bacterium]
MNILFLTQVVPFPPDAGPKVKTYHVLRALVGQGHAVTLVSFVRPEEVQHVPALQGICDAVYTVPIRRSRVADFGFLLRSFLTDRPFLIERDDLRPMRELVNKLVCEGDFQFIHADQLTMVQFAIGAAASCMKQKPKVIFDAHNAVWTIVDRMQENSRWLLHPVLRLEADRIKRYEGKLLQTVDQVLAVTDVDEARLKEALDSSNSTQGTRVAPITVVPIAVDTQKLQPITRCPRSKNIVTLGTLHYPPNADGIRWFMHEVFPLIQKRMPDVTLTVIGKNPPQDFLDAQAQQPDAIRVIGYVPELAPHLEQSTIMVVPVRAGGGMRVRILEAFAYGMPVVTTTVGLEGIHAIPAADVLVADTASEFACSVIMLLEEPSLQEKLATNGRRLAETKYDWQVVLAAMKPIYEC